MAKTKLTLSIEENKVKEFKKLAIDADMTLSDYLTTAGTITSPEQIKKQQPDQNREVITLPDGQKVYKDLYERSQKEAKLMIENLKIAAEKPNE